MSAFNPLGFQGGPATGPNTPQAAQAAVGLALHRILEFTNHSIHDVVNDPVVKNQVAGYYKLDGFIRRYFSEHEDRS